LCVFCAHLRLNWGLDWGDALWCEMGPAKLGQGLGARGLVSVKAPTSEPMSSLTYLWGTR
jgi:hypothetical protein